MGDKGCLCCYLPFCAVGNRLPYALRMLLSCTSWTFMVFAFYSDLVII